MSLNIRNARWTNAAHTQIRVEFEHPEFGWIPFDADPNDVEEHGRSIFASAAPIAQAYEPPAFPQLQALKLAALAEKRWQVETGGIVVMTMPVHTDDRSKLMIAGARIKADADAAFTTNWVAADGSIVTLGAAQIIAISDAVLAHVDECFARFAVLVAAINAAADEPSLDAVDIGAGWPPNG